MLAILIALFSSPVVAGPVDRFPGNMTGMTSQLTPGAATNTDGKYAFSVNCYRLQSIGSVDLAEVLATPGYYPFSGGLTASFVFNPTDKHGVILYRNTLMAPPLSPAYPANYTPVASDTPAFRSTFTWLSPRYTGTAPIWDGGNPAFYTMEWNVFVVVTGNWYFDGTEWWFVLDDYLNNIGGEEALPNPYIDDSYNYDAYVTQP